MDLPQIAVTWQPRLLGLLRIATALLLLQHGTAKALRLSACRHVRHHAVPVAPQSRRVSGTRRRYSASLWHMDRPVAFLLSGEMAVAYFLAHAQKASFPFSIRASLRRFIALSCFISRWRGRRLEFDTRQVYAAFHLIEQPTDGI